MPAISRQVGTTSEYLMVFIPDATVSTGAGLANINVTNITMAWFRSDMAAASTLTLSSGTLGTWANSTCNQVLSNGALGWYALSVPNGVFASGRSAMIHLAGAPSMAPVPILIELTKTDNQTYLSASTLSTTLNSLNADTRAILGSTPVTSVAGMLSVNVSTIHLQTAVTNAPGLFTVNLSTILGSTPVTSAAGTLKTDVLTILGSTPVTSAAGTLKVDLASIYATAPVTQSAGILATVWDLGRTANATSTVALTGVSVNYVTTAGNASGNITQVYGSALVTTAAGVLATTWDLGRTANLTSTIALTGLSTLYTTTAGTLNANGDKTGYALTAAYDPSKTAAQAGDAMALTSGERNSVADALLNRNVAGGSSAGRLVKEGLYVLRNKVDAGAGIVYGTDDTTSSWAFAVTTAAGNPIQIIDPA